MRYKLTLSYHGSPFKGWQKQSKHSTVQGSIERALFVLFGTHIEVFGSGRTDQGVHALGQVAHVDLPKAVEPYVLMRGLNHFLRPHISITHVEKAWPDFHARFDAINRTYHYQIYESAAPCPFMTDRSWHINQPLDLKIMQEAAHFFLGQHDFSAFRSSECQSRTPIRTLNTFELLNDQRTWCIQARSFLHHQVRFMMGSLVYIGLGKEKPEWIKNLLSQSEKKPYKAPPQGLFLVQVDYPRSYETK